ncbi:hypothetical protein HYV86_03815 [Candidatus Woesearchaeota archaeon]|nr:hypothetical protein [Candidatus Woesearchaeota archaeon]
MNEQTLIDPLDMTPPFLRYYAYDRGDLVYIALIQRGEGNPHVIASPGSNGLDVIAHYIQTQGDGLRILNGPANFQSGYRRLTSEELTRMQQR